MKPRVDSPFLDGEWWTPPQDLLAVEEEETRGSGGPTPVADASVAPLRWVCRISARQRIERPGGGSSTHGPAPVGSGLLITARHVLTAAHLLSTPANAGGAKHHFDTITVTPGLDAGTAPFGSVDVDHVDFHPDWKDTDLGAEHDLALLTLARPVGRATFRSLGGQMLGCWGSTPGHHWLVDLPPALAARILETPLLTAGFPGSVRGQMVSGSGRLQVANEGERRALDSGPKIETWLRQRTVHQVDTRATKGQSGSPVWVEDGGRRYLIGVMVDDGGRVNHIVTLTPRVHKLVQGWIAGPRRQQEAEDEAALEAEAQPETLEEPETVDEAPAAPVADTEPEEGFEAPVADEAFDDEDLEHLGVFEHDTPPLSNPATLGFEFDLNYGFETKVVDAMGLGPPPGWAWPAEGLQATDHEGRDGAGKIADGFVVTMDAVRMEIATVPVKVDDDAEFNAVAAKVVAFGRELQAAEKTPQRDTPVPGVGGRPTLLHHPRTVVNQPERKADGHLAFPGDRKHAKYRREPVPLVIHRLFGRYPEGTALWSAPQATLTLPLAEFGKLVWEIHGTVGGAPGEALSGPADARLGLRDDLAWTALKLAIAERKRRVGSRLDDGTLITDAMFSRALTSLLAILFMYMLTGATIDPRDERAEFYAKGSLPINVKTPLWAIHRHALNDDERRLLHALYTGPGRREAFFALVPRRPPGKSETPLFPPRTDVDTRRFFDAVPTWRTLLEALVDEKPVRVTKDIEIEKKGHKKGDEILIAPLSSKIDWDRTQPRIAVELRRIGFAPVPLARWASLMDRVRALAKKVNP